MRAIGIQRNAISAPTVWLSPSQGCGAFCYSGFEESDWLAGKEFKVVGVRQVEEYEQV